MGRIASLILRRLLYLAIDKDSYSDQKSDHVFLVAPSPEVSAANIVHQGKDASAHRNSWRASMNCLFPRIQERADLTCLLHVKRLSRVLSNFSVELR